MPKAKFEKIGEQTHKAAYPVESTKPVDGANIEDLLNRVKYLEEKLKILESYFWEHYAGGNHDNMHPKKLSRRWPFNLRFRSPITKVQ